MAKYDLEQGVFIEFPTDDVHNMQAAIEASKAVSLRRIADALEKICQYQANKE